MSKILKRFLIILIVLIGTIVVIPKLEQASVNMGNDDIIYGFKAGETYSYYVTTERRLSELKAGNPIYVVNPWILNNKNVFCIQEGQDLVDGNYELTNTIQIDSNSGGWAQGLAYLLDKATVAWDGNNNQYAFRSDKVQLALWAYFRETGSSPDSFFGLPVSLHSNGKWSQNFSGNTEAKKLLNEALLYYRGQKVGTFRATLHVMRHVSENGYRANSSQAIIIIEKTEPETPKFQFNLNKVDEQGSSVSGAKFDVEISGIKNVTVDGTNYSSYNKNITVNGTQRFTNIEQAPNADYITVKVKETEAPSKLYEIDETTYIRYFRYYDGEWQSSMDTIAWTKCNSSFTLSVKNNHTVEPPKPKVETIYPKIDGYAWVDLQQGDKAAQVGDGIYRKQRLMG